MIAVLLVWWATWQSLSGWRSFFVQIVEYPLRSKDEMPQQCGPLKRVRGWGGGGGWLAYVYGLRGLHTRIRIRVPESGGDGTGQASGAYGCHHQDSSIMILFRVWNVKKIEQP